MQYGFSEEMGECNAITNVRVLHRKPLPLHGKSPFLKVLHLPETNRHFVSEDGEPLKEVKTRSGISLNARPIRDVWCHVYVMPHCGLKRAAIGGDANAEVCIRKPSLSVGTCEDLGSAGKTFLPERGNIQARFFRHRKGLGTARSTQNNDDLENELQENRRFSL